MHYSLGIDAGGTYTDVILVRDSDGSVVDSNKSLTTYPDLVVGIRNAIDGLDSQYLEKVSLVSVSTTLATNTVLEGTGSPVALILVGEHPIKGEFPAEHVLSIPGGHGFNGEEIEKPDIGAVRKFTQKSKTMLLPLRFLLFSVFVILNMKIPYVTLFMNLQGCLWSADMSFHRI
ncbi:hydantoinase/oxoprolinase N-terminal domain-containing protein [Methanolobus sp. ZRKC4]|uniref:hydantoinase/oxoprolinase N-terminal domain-containing protein n=1 Tax=Methanolobus sp. ZRKC4 TaxID=3125787 RepID=UPI0032521D96